LKATCPELFVVPLRADDRFPPVTVTVAPDTGLLNWFTTCTVTCTVATAKLAVMVTLLLGI